MSRPTTRITRWQERQNLRERESALVELFARFRRARRAIATRASQNADVGEDADANVNPDGLAERLQNVEAQFLGHDIERKQSRLYLVGRYNSIGPAKIRVTDTTGPVVLAVCGQQSIEWHIEAAEGVEIVEIIAGGSMEQQVTKSPTGVPVRSVFGKDGFSLQDGRDLLAVKRVKKRLQELTGLELAAYTAAHRADGVQIVGPEDGGQRIQIIRQELIALQKEAATPDGQVRLMSKLEKKRFHAIHHGPLPRMNEGRSRDKRFWNTFSTKGPLIGNSVEIDRQVQHAQADRKAERLFTLANTTLKVRDLKKGGETTLQLRQKCPMLGQVSGMAFDAKGNRLFLDTSRELFQLDPDSGKMTSIRRKNQQMSIGFAWSSKRRVLYSAQIDRSGRGEIRRIQRFNEFGASLSAIELSHPYARNRYYGPGGLFQLIDLDEYVALLEYRMERNVRMVNGRNIYRPPTGQIMVIEVASGEIVYEGAVEPNLEMREVSDSELSATWQSLGEQTLPNLDSVLWSMASGGSATVDFLRTRYQRTPPTIDTLEVAALLKDLNDNRFSVREEAFQRLQTAGCSIESALMELIATTNPSSEVRERVQLLVTNWSSGTPLTADEFRQVRGLEVLARVDLPESRALLETLQGDGFDSLVRHYARRMVESKKGHDANAALQFPRQLFVPRQEAEE